MQVNNHIRPYPVLKEIILNETAMAMEKVCILKPKHTSVTLVFRD
jgi:hypothetical protein